MKKKKLLKIGISTGEYQRFIDQIIELAREKSGGYVCVANVHMVIEAHDDEEYLKVVNHADIVTPDGMPLALMVKLLYGERQDRVAGMDLLPDLLKISEKEKIPVFFYGSTEDVLSKVKIKLSDQYSGLIVSGLISPPFGGISADLLDEHIKEINKGEAGIVFIALGCPKQEKFMAEISGRVNHVLIGIGAAVSVFSGEVRRAPGWMQKSSLEWFFRLIQEPKRLWKRYLYTNTRFILLAIGELLKRKILKKRDKV